MKTDHDSGFQKTLASIDWTQIQKEMASRCKSLGGRNQALALQPMLSWNVVEKESALSAAFYAHQESLQSLGLSVCDGVEGVLEMLTKGEVLRPRDFLVFSDFFTLSRAVDTLMSRIESPLVAEMRAGFGWSRFHKELQNAIDERISRHGEVLSDASPKLSMLSRQEQSDRAAIERNLEALVRKCQYQDMLMETYVTLRDGRYVLPVKIQFQNNVRGIIHDVSNSKKTAFIEPFQIVKVNNHLILVLEAKQEERYKVLRHLSNQFLSQSKELRNDLELLFDLDVIASKLQLGEKLGGRLVAPKKRFSECGLVLEDLKHPLLVLKGGDVVPNTVVLRAGDRLGLVVSGPNQGGKTILLKSVGCAVMMSYCGIPIPCGERSVIPEFSWCRFVVGDQQSLQEGVSSFAFQVDMIKDVPPEDGDGLLVVDEIMSSTDPEEGEVLAQALLSLWLENPNIVFLVTTHFSRIRVLSATGQYPLGYGSMSYVDGVPTYRFLENSLGQSFGLETALAKGLSPVVIDRARELMGEQKVEISRLVETLQTETAQHVQERRSLKTQRDMLEREIERLKLREQEVEEKREKLEVETLHDVWREFEVVLKDLRAAVSKRTTEPEELGDAEKKAQGVVEKIRGRLAAVASRHNPKKGEWFFIPHLGKVQILDWQQEKGFSLVRCKDKTIRLSLDHFSHAKKMKD